MPTILYKNSINSEDRETIYGVHHPIFLEGECYAFAIALHRGLAWPLVGLMHEGTIWHAGVRTPDGRVHDIRGPLSDEKFSEYFCVSSQNIRDITIDELYAIRPISNFIINQARDLAEVLWPELPWIEESSARVAAFADELEALCRKHGFWIRGSVPANPPRLYNAFGGEGGYEIRPTVDGLAYTIDRWLQE